VDSIRLGTFDNIPICRGDALIVSEVTDWNGEKLQIVSSFMVSKITETNVKGSPFGPTARALCLVHLLSSISCSVIEVPDYRFKIEKSLWSHVTIVLDVNGNTKWKK